MIYRVHVEGNRRDNGHRYGRIVCALSGAAALAVVGTYASGTGAPGLDVTSIRVERDLIHLGNGVMVERGTAPTAAQT